MKIDVGESLVNSYLRHIKGCCIVQQSWKPSENWPIGEEELYLARKEFERIQRHKAFTEIFKTSFDHTIKQTEIDVVGYTHDKTIYAANVTFHEYGINFGSRTDTRNRVIKNLLRAYLTMICYFPGYKHELLYCSPKVTGTTEEVLQDYFRILENDFNAPGVSFRYLSNESFRDQVLMQTLNTAMEQFDTSEIFLRSFKLLTVYASDLHEDEGKASEKSSPEAMVKEQERVEATPERISADEMEEPETAERADLPPAGEEDPSKGAEPSGAQPLANDPAAVKGVRTVKRKRIKIAARVTPAEKPVNEELQVTAVPEEKKVVNESADNKIEELELLEIEKIKNRVPKWFKKPEQNNSKILIRFMELFEKEESVTVRQLAAICEDVKNFPVNFSQMNRVNIKNHGKVFQVEGDVITLWEPVRDLIIREFIDYKKSFYSGE